ncbi:hypothetical protein HPB49_025608 [Dermacentor silvarum]|uniref:Uncharacterized protein n=1 Tax=Dermacentor silvarum TaxID=543639 RepID=A0ACB8CIN1_DERSI|nr:hypothetical protein HPB49_025608 [Dermacentor silvarum]
MALAPGPPPRRELSRKPSVAAVVRPLPPVWELNQQQGNKSRRPSGWGLVQNPYRSDIRAWREEDAATPSTTTMMWSYWKRRAVAIIVILFSIVVLAVAFYLITDLTVDSKEGIFAKPWIHRRVAVEDDICVGSFTNCRSTAYRCTLTRGCQPWHPEEYCLAGGARFATMDECRHTCQNGSEPCAIAEACPCRGDYRTANYVHRRGRGCLRLADRRCLVRPTRGFDTLAHCQRQCGSHGTNGQHTRGVSLLLTSAM